MNKILEFRIPVRTTQKPSDSSLVQEQKSAIIRELVGRESEFMEPEEILHFYKERLVHGDVQAVFFFLCFGQLNEVIIVNEGGYICSESVLIVKTKTNRIHKMTVAKFIHLTEPVSWMVQEENIDRYITQILDNLVIKKNSIEAKDIVSESVMSREDAEIFHAEDILSDSKDGYYACCINNLNGRWIDYTIDHFVSIENLPLLYLLCHSYQGHFGNGCSIDEEQLQIELDYIEWIFINSRHISFSLLQEIILSAIERKNPLYCHFPSDKRIKKFYDDVVFPLLSDEYLTGEFEE